MLTELYNTNNHHITRKELDCYVESQEKVSLLGIRVIIR